VIFTPATAALLIRANGGTDEEAIFLASVIPGESGGNPDAFNDAPCGTENGRVLHAIGLFQVCDYTSRGTQAQLFDPAHNAREALKILRAQGRAAWTATPDDDAADEARRALAGGESMETWHPRAIHAGANRDAGSYVGAPWKLILHTVEAPSNTLYQYDPTSYFGNPYWPHATIDTAGIHQHLGIGGSAFALYHASGQPETNRANAIQCEIMAQAANIGDLPDETMRHLADWLTWCAAQTGCPLVFPAMFVAYPESYGEDAAQRLHDQKWTDATGILGHEHVDQNDHGDPGAFPVARLAALLGPAQPDHQEDITMLIGYNSAGVGLFYNGETVGYISADDKNALLKTRDGRPGVPEFGVLSDDFWRSLGAPDTVIALTAP
jgi:hypothetical protein